jgi:serine-type D-Ala-D-Ala carboxypeptidase (penicillin-binding protein 5/6)
VRGLLALLLASVSLSLATSAAAASLPPFIAKAVIVADGASGEVLYEYNADAPLPIASITKVMTALVALETTEPDESVRVGKAAPAVGESSIYLQPGERLSVQDLLAATLIQSANDAAYALASHVGRGSAERFVELMNERAQTLGLENTHFVRPEGLDETEHYSSARDVLKLSRQAMRKPLFRRLVRMKRATLGDGRLVRASNDLLRSFPGTIGVKTGHTDGAGWSQVVAARREGRTIYVVLLGGPSRAQRNADLAELIDWGFDQYGLVSLVSTGQTYATSAIPFSDDKLRLVATESVRQVVRLGRPFVQRVVAPAMVALPVERGQRLGEICVDDGKRELCRPLVAAEAVAKPSLRRRTSWYAGRALDHAGGVFDSVFGGVF